MLTPGIPTETSPPMTAQRGWTAPLPWVLRTIQGQGDLGQHPVLTPFLPGDCVHVGCSLILVFRSVLGPETTSGIFTLAYIKLLSPRCRCVGFCKYSRYRFPPAVAPQNSALPGNTPHAPRSLSTTPTPHPCQMPGNRCLPPRQFCSFRRSSTWNHTNAACWGPLHLTVPTSDPSLHRFVA